MQSGVRESCHHTRGRTTAELTRKLSAVDFEECRSAKSLQVLGCEKFGWEN